MIFELTEEQMMIRQAARDFAQNVLKKEVIARDREMRYPYEEVKQMAELGFLGIYVIVSCTFEIYLLKVNLFK